VRSPATLIIVHFDLVQHFIEDTVLQLVDTVLQLVTGTLIIVHFDLVQHFIEDTVLQLVTGN
jgi:hypothetical protein